MISVYSKNKGIGLTVPILMEGSVLQLPAVRKQGVCVCVCVCVCVYVGECLHVFVFRLKDSIVRSKKGPPLSRCEGESFQIQTFDPNS